MSLEVKIGLVDGMDLNGIVPAGHVVRIGGAKVEGRDNIGFRPMELFLISLGACSAVSMTHLLRKKRQDVTDFRINIAGKKSETIPMVFTSIEMEYIIKGRSISEKAVRHAVALTEKNCSVMAMLKREVNVSMRYELFEERA